MPIGRKVGLGDIFGALAQAGAGGITASREAEKRREEDERTRKAEQIADLLMLSTPGGGTAVASKKQLFQGLGVPGQQPQTQQLIPGREQPQKEVIPTWQREGFENLEDWKKFQLQRKATGVPRAPGKKEPTPEDEFKEVLAGLFSKRALQDPINRIDDVQFNDMVQKISDIFGVPVPKEFTRPGGLFTEGAFVPPEGITPPKTKEVTPQPTGEEVDNTQKVISSLKGIKDKEARLAAYEKAKAGFVGLEIDDAAVRKALGLK